MKKNLLRVMGAALIGTMGVSCSTSYDAYGNRRQSISPGGAVVGAVALGALAYSIGKDDGKRKERRRTHQKYENYHEGYRFHNRDDRRYRPYGAGYGSERHRIDAYHR